MIQLDHINNKLNQVLENIDQIVIGKRHVSTLSLVALLAEGHILLEDVPGVGKTMLVKALAKSIDAEFKRIQFTPDLLPSDVTGVSIYSPKDMEFHFRSGPIMSHIVLADEINRTSPKTQSALLEAMAEHHVTTDGITREIPAPFFVMATQNPVDFDGTYHLPEAQLDRFLFKLSMGYPTQEEELQILNGVSTQVNLEDVKPVMSVPELVQAQKAVSSIYVDDTIKNYIIEIIRKTRSHPHVSLGISPRGTVSFMKAIQAYALVKGRDYCLPDDVQELASYVCAHRLTLRPDTQYSGLTASDVMKQIMADTKVPVKR
ncbi:AAA family ATPase [Priestia aryabhattai]|uniref:AAA family ATPase n=1 Tax=Priestia aryabhattai TaxID=412384 RepID=UPI000BF43F83|nr:MoxR family ATPase [Priestia aryabhattai]PGA16230.1 AAA family ATPase [Priestia aryabhattai]